jgi:hypothetical protein
MQLIEVVSLIEFYKSYRRALRERGFKILLLALIREADAPTFYSDLERYWTSLDDVTGKQILFAVAGSSASARTGKAQLIGSPDASALRFASELACCNTHQPTYSWDYKHTKQAVEISRQMRNHTSQVPLQPGELAAAVVISACQTTALLIRCD